MDFNITDELKNICKKIVNVNKTVEQWAEIESGDMFQTENFEGGFDADEEKKNSVLAITIQTKMSIGFK